MCRGLVEEHSMKRALRVDTGESPQGGTLVERGGNDTAWWRKAMFHRVWQGLLMVWCYASKEISDVGEKVGMHAKEEEDTVHWEFYL